MPNTLPTTITAVVTITPSDGTYSWSYSGDYINSATGEITLPNQNPATIIYTLDSLSQQDYSFCFVNLSKTHAITRQVTSIQIDATSIVIQDKNLQGATETTPFGLILIARPHGNINAPIISPDPVVDNEPGARPPLCE